MSSYELDADVRAVVIESMQPDPVPGEAEVLESTQAKQIGIERIHDVCKSNVEEGPSKKNGEVELPLEQPNVEALQFTVRTPFSDDSAERCATPM